MTPLLIQALAEHAMGNIQAMMLMANELLASATATESEQRILFFEVFRRVSKKKGI
jgi:hypothetical protein